MANTEMVANPYGTNGSIASSAAVEIEQKRAITEVQAMAVMAANRPRNEQQCIDKILMACARPSLAESAVYSYAKGGTAITGPSIRLAEAMARAWTNMTYGIRELSQANGESEVEAFAWDLETNTRTSITFTVKHIRVTKTSRITLTDPRDIYELMANNAARRVRKCILELIPGDVTEAAVEQCEKTLKAKADVTPEGIQRMIAHFAKYGVTKAHIEKHIQRRLEAITPAIMVTLMKIYTSLKDEMSRPEEWFDMTTPTVAGAAAPTSRAEDVKAKMAAKVPLPEDNPADDEERETEPEDVQEEAPNAFDDDQPNLVHPDPDQVADAPEPICTDCGKILTPDLLTRSVEKYGEPVCFLCSTKRDKAAKSAQEMGA